MTGEKHSLDTTNAVHSPVHFSISWVRAQEALLTDHTSRGVRSSHLKGVTVKVEHMLFAVLACATLCCAMLCWAVLLRCADQHLGACPTL